MPKVMGPITMFLYNYSMCEKEHPYKNGSQMLREYLAVTNNDNLYDDKTQHKAKIQLTIA